MIKSYYLQYIKEINNNFEIISDFLAFINLITLILIFLPSLKALAVFQNCNVFKKSFCLFLKTKNYKMVTIKTGKDMYL